MADFSVILQTPEVRALVQENMLERAFHDALFPRMLFRMEAVDQEWPGHVGDTPVFTGVGLIDNDLTPLTPGTDPVPTTYQHEQWTATIRRYARTIDTDMPTSAVAIADRFYRNSHQMGMSSAQTLNRLPRNAMYNAALSGWTVATGAQTAVTTLAVQRINGFTRARRPDLALGSPVRFDFVSTNNPLPIIVNVGGTPTPVNVVGFAATTSGDEVGPGTLTLDAAVTVVDRAYVYSVDRSFMVRVGGALSVDGVGSSNLLRLQDLRSAVARFRQSNVPPFTDGYFHCHFDPTAESQIYADNEFQRLLTSLPDYYMYRDFALGKIQQTVFFTNTESPLPETVTGAPTSFAVSSFSQKDPFAGELINASGVRIHRSLFVGQGGLYEYWQNLASGMLLTEAGVTGRTGTSMITNNGIEVNTDRIQLIIRAPLNRTQDQVATTWLFHGDWSVRTDATTGDAARYKRFLVIESGE